MEENSYRTADRPTMYFIGVTTARSSIMRVFPAWAEHLGLTDAVLKGIDFARHDAPERYREAVAFIKHDPLSLGALVTTHKLDLLSAASDLFDDLGPYAELTGEVSSISKEARQLVGRAKDPITSGLALEHFLPADYWMQHDAEVLIFGAGGSSLALTCYLAEERHGTNRPGRIVVTNRSEARLQSMKQVHEKMDMPIPMEYELTPENSRNDDVLREMRPGSLVVNATGLGKDAPGSPVTDNAVFPAGAFAWDFNYRGDLTFLVQAEKQRHSRGLHIEDGWVYFVHGWTQVIADVFHIDIPSSGEQFEHLSRIAADIRTPPPARATESPGTRSQT